MIGKRMMSSGDERSGEEDDERRRGMEVFGGGDQNGGGSVFICIVIEAKAFELCVCVCVWACFACGGSVFGFEKALALEGRQRYCVV